MDEENQQPRARVSRSFIFSIIIVAAIIALIAFVIFSNVNTATTISPDTFVNELYDGHITEATITSGSNIVTVNGRAQTLDKEGHVVKDSKGNAKLYNFTLNIPITMFEQDIYWIDMNDNDIKEAGETVSVAWTVAYALESYGPNSEAKTFVLKDSVEPYRTTWWI